MPAPPRRDHAIGSRAPRRRQTQSRRCKPATARLRRTEARDRAIGAPSLVRRDIALRVRASRTSRLARNLASRAFPRAIRAGVLLYREPVEFVADPTTAVTEQPRVKSAGV
jgi:hypothetical protein